MGDVGLQQTALSLDPRAALSAPKRKLNAFGAVTSGT